jgi:acetaldehyde/propanal dehydrogenase
MRDTMHCLTVDEPTRRPIIESIHAMIAEVQKYVPGYRLVNGPVFDGKRVSVYLEVEGLGDYLPKYAGNLDIMTAAARAPPRCSPRDPRRHPGARARSA